MSYVRIICSKKVEKITEQRLKIFIGDLINDIPGKDENWLMISFHHEENIYFRGEEKDAAIVEISILGNVDIKYKDRLTSKISDILEQELFISKMNIYVIFHEIPHGSWGWKGELF